MAEGHYLRAVKGAVDGGYNFWLAVPKDYKQSDKPLPLVVFLHGASLCGRDMNRTKRYGTINAIEKGLELDAIVIGPQNPGGAWSPQRIARVMDYVEQHYNVDKNREYALGMSLGSFGTLDLVGTYPDRFAAAIAICGGTSLKNYEGLASLPLWIIHGTADRDVPVSRSREIVNTIRKNYDDDLLRYSELKGINHSKPCRLFYHIDTYDWLLKHHLKHRMVDRSYEVSASTVHKPYSLSRKGNQKSMFDGEFDASLSPNHSPKSIDEEHTAHHAKHEEAQADKPTKTKASKTRHNATHTVHKGDNLSAIARRYHTSVDKLCRLNGIGKNATLRLGQKLKVE